MELPAGSPMLSRSPQRTQAKALHAGNKQLFSSSDVREIESEIIRKRKVKTCRKKKDMSDQARPSQKTGELQEETGLTKSADSVLMVDRQG